MEFYWRFTEIFHRLRNTRLFAFCETEKRDGSKEGLVGFERLGNLEGQPLMRSN